MLKIKDRVNLKVLEKFGFEEKEDSLLGLKYYSKATEKEIIVWSDSRIIEFYDRYFTSGYIIINGNLYETLYDLIQAGFVEKTNE